ncbi:MAG: FAD-binding oxidoreductase [Desulfobacterales bacterium]|jgi:D-lactate dehydrogenase (cytochrome)|nr:FAD-binding oxidoreductase [Desulfobacterales bacterium]
MHEITSQSAETASFEAVRRVEGFENIAAEFPAYLTDESKFSCKPFDHLFFPRSEAELAAVMREMGRRGTRVTFAGARTGLVGGCVPDQGALISLENFDRILALYYDAPSAEWRLKAQCAVNLRTIAAQLAVKSLPDIERCADGMSLLEMDRFRQDPDHYFYPPDPTEMSASLGGTVATNASGARTFRYGPTRDWVRGVRVMLANGELLDIPRGKYFASPAGTFTVTDSAGRDFKVSVPSYGSPRTKNTAGFFATPHMDLVDLFIGSEGAFGVITAVTVALLKRRPKISVVQFLTDDDQAIALVEALRADPRIRLDFLEFYSGTAVDLLRRRQERDARSVGTPAIPPAAGAALFFELDFDPADRSVQMEALDAAITRCGASPADSWSAYESRELERLKNFRHILPETINALIAERKKKHPGLHKLGTDLAVPDERLADMWAVYRDALAGAGLEWAAFGHIGNNHLHINILPRDMEDLARALGLYQMFAEKAVAFGGTVSAEHGVGKLKAKFLKTMYSESEIEQMRAVKRALDPQLLLNPGNIFE